MTMKKTIAILLALVLVFGLAACAGTPAPTPAPPAATPAPGADPTPEPAPPAASLTGTLTIIVPFSAGGSTDLMARVLQPALAERLGVNVVIENRGGGGGAPGMMALAQSAPDGHTIALTSISSATLTPNISNVGYTNVEFQPVAHISVLPTGPWARTGEGIYTLEDLIRVASENPGRMTFSAGGAGGVHHVGAELFFASIGMPGLLTHVPFDSGAEGFAAFLGGHVDFAWNTADDGAMYYAEGLVIPLATGAAEACPIMPEIPTFRSLGYDVVFGSWWGFVAPAGIPQDLLELLDNAIRASLEDPEVIALFENLNQPINYMDHVAFTNLWMSEFESNRALLIELGLSDFAS